MIIESRDIVFFEYIFSYKRKEEKTSGKRTKHRSGTKDPMNQQSMQKLNQEEVRDPKSQNPSVQTS